MLPVWLLKTVLAQNLAFPFNFSNVYVEMKVYMDPYVLQKLKA